MKRSSERSTRRVLSAIGGEPVGHATFRSVVGRLPDQAGTAGTALTRALKLLSADKGVVAIDVPTGADASTKLRRYRIHDPYLRFWFRFVAVLAGTDDVGSWWVRDNRVEVDLVASQRGAVLAMGSVKWRERRPFAADELAALAHARFRVPGASAAALVVVCPAGARPEVDADLVLNAADLLGAWTA